MIAPTAVCPASCSGLAGTNGWPVISVACAPSTWARWTITETESKLRRPCSHALIVATVYPGSSASRRCVQPLRNRSRASRCPLVMLVSWAPSS
nr:hypothetical protein [Carbonactinospora thermoautotrophica]